MNRTQEDCVEHRGQCAGCPNKLESQPCQVKHTDGVAQKLGLPRKGPDYERSRAIENERRLAGKRRDGKPGVCRQCGTDYVRAYGSRATTCDPCRIASRNAHIIDCRTCQAPYVGAYQSKGHCPACLMDGKHLEPTEGGHRGGGRRTA